MAWLNSPCKRAWWALRISVGLGLTIAGIDKFFNRLADWGMYLGPLATRAIPMEPDTLMHLVGVVEVLAGLIVFSKWTKAGSYFTTIWLLGIAANLASTGMFLDLAARDLEIAVAAFALSQRTPGGLTSGYQPVIGRPSFGGA